MKSEKKKHFNMGLRNCKPKKDTFDEKNHLIQKSRVRGIKEDRR